MPDGADDPAPRFAVGRKAEMIRWKAGLSGVGSAEIQTGTRPAEEGRWRSLRKGYHGAKVASVMCREQRGRPGAPADGIDDGSNFQRREIAAAFMLRPVNLA